MRPADFCRQLLAALDASEGRRKRRKRDTTPDAIGMALKRGLLERAVRDDPEPEAFERWLLERCLAAGNASGPLRAMAPNWCSVSRFSTTMKCQGCSLNEDGAQRAASKRLRSFSGSTERLENARGLQRCRRISSIG